MVARFVLIWGVSVVMYVFSKSQPNGQVFDLVIEKVPFWKPLFKLVETSANFQKHLTYHRIGRTSPLCVNPCHFFASRFSSLVSGKNEKFLDWAGVLVVIQLPLFEKLDIIFVHNEQFNTRKKVAAVDRLIKAFSWKVWSELWKTECIFELIKVPESSIASIWFVIKITICRVLTVNTAPIMLL